MNGAGRSGLKLTKQEFDQQVQASEQLALEYYQERLRASKRKNFAAGVTHWLDRIHQLEEHINERHASRTK